MTTLTNDDTSTLPFLKQLDSEGRIKLIICPHPFQLGTAATPGDLILAAGPPGADGAVGGEMDLNGDITIIGTLSVLPPPVEDHTVETHRLYISGTMKIEDDITDEYMPTDQFPMGSSIDLFTVAGINDAGLKTSLMMHQQGEDESRFRTVELCCVGASAVNDGTIFTIVTVDVNTDHDERFRIDEEGRIILGSGSWGWGSAYTEKGCVAITSDGYPQLQVIGDDHSIGTMSGSIGSEISWNFNKHDGQTWKIGMDNTDDSGGEYVDYFSIKTVNGEDPEFAIDPDISTKPALVILEDGVTVVNVKAGRLHVSGSTGPAAITVGRPASSPSIKASAEDASSGYLIIDSADNDGFYVNRYSDAGDFKINYGSGGDTYIHNLGSPGAGTWYYVMSETTTDELARQSSTRRIKRNIESSNIGLDDILKLNPVTFEYKRDEPGIQTLGLIAEEVYEVHPIFALIGPEWDLDEFGQPKNRLRLDADGNDDGMERILLSDDLVPLDWDQRPVVAALVNSVKELKAENNSLLARVEALEALLTGE